MSGKGMQCFGNISDFGARQTVRGYVIISNASCEA